MGLVSLVSGIAAIPFVGALSALQWLATRTPTVLDLTVERTASLYEREQLRLAIREAGRDPRVAGILLRLREAPAGWGSSQDLRDVISEVRAKGTRVYAFVESAGNAVTAIAAACDRVFVVPTGEIGLVGVGAELTFFGAALGRLGVVPDFEAAGAYKSFGEPFTRSFPSAANQEATRELVSDLQAQLVDAIGVGRGLTVEQTQDLFARAPLSATQALAGGLVDELAYEDELEDKLSGHLGKKIKLRSFASYAWRVRWLARLRGLAATGPKIAVVHLEGAIAMEASARGMSARAVVPILRALREDDDVVAVVLHVDSPGGSALASDLMWREVDLLNRKKVVLAAFADVSASGGVYLAAPAREIFVRPGTLTGSIGVFGGKLVVAEGLRQVGVYNHPVLGSPNAAVFSAARPFTDDQRVRFRESLQRFYDGFVTRVAEGRKKPVDVVEPHCRGRVWTGRAALSRGLVDHTSGLDGAIARAAELAGKRGWRRSDVLGRRDPPFSRLLRGLTGRLVPGAALRWKERLFPAALEVLLSHQGEPMMLLPEEVDVG